MKSSCTVFLITFLVVSSSTSRLLLILLVCKHLWFFDIFVTYGAFVVFECSFFPILNVYDLYVLSPPLGYRAASNGNPRSPNSLHYIDPSGRLNPYQQVRFCYVMIGNTYKSI